MDQWPDTRDTLLARLRDPADQLAWAEFVAVYQPLIYRFARSRGLQDADSRDVTQHVLWAVARAADRWQPDPSKGRFRGWLARVTTNAAINVLQRGARQAGSGGSGIQELIENAPNSDSALSHAWRHERRLELFRYAAKSLRDQFSDDTWQAFWLTAVDGQPGDKVARELHKSVGAIYVARSRVVAKLRAFVQELEALESEDIK